MECHAFSLIGLDIMCDKLQTNKPWTKEKPERAAAKHCFTLTNWPFLLLVSQMLVEVCISGSGIEIRKFSSSEKSSIVKMTKNIIFFILAKFRKCATYRSCCLLFVAALRILSNCSCSSLGKVVLISSSIFSMWCARSCIGSKMEIK